MAIKLKPTAYAACYTIGDESGYKFDIRTSLDDEWGWQAFVSISTYGRGNEQNAVDGLIPAVEHLLRMLKEKDEKESSEGKVLQEGNEDRICASEGNTGGTGSS